MSSLQLWSEHWQDDKVESSTTSRTDGGNAEPGTSTHLDFLYEAALDSSNGTHLRAYVFIASSMVVQTYLVFTSTNFKLCMTGWLIVAACLLAGEVPFFSIRMYLAGP